MKKSNKSIPNFSNQTFKLMEIDGKEEIFAQDFHSDEWNDGKEEFGVKKINQLSDTTNELTSVSKEQTNTINKLTSVSKEQTNTINELIKRIQQLEKDGQKDIYYKGEYKWMKIGSIMPAGWIKVSMGTGFTLINGTTEGISNGVIAAHSHKSQHNYFVECKFSDTTTHWNNDLEGTDNGYPNNKIRTTKDTFTSKYNRTANSDYSNKENFAAGKYAELWEYNPNKYAEIVTMGLTPREYDEMKK